MTATQYLLLRGPSLSSITLCTVFAQLRVKVTQIIAFHTQSNVLSAHLLFACSPFDLALRLNQLLTSVSVKRSGQLEAQTYLLFRCNHLLFETIRLALRQAHPIITGHSWLVCARRPTTPLPLSGFAATISQVFGILFLCCCEFRFCILPTLFNQSGIHNANQIITSYIIRCMQNEFAKVFGEFVSFCASTRSLLSPLSSHLSPFLLLSVEKIAGRAYYLFR